ncbi:hypothetical protein PLICRDRAFT_33051 [Plicaturopsis crispa FD-325 SS-3]|uniref:DNA 3'-5' helicase n=1 Tax=Plicaturopsis crispa FD-325 SS-3 TaxID=944288 RepID=A0A0C9SQ00_PLICR|nr:hypothetical protein PLICRDRAFT_33051 [Plicaturopsis crispa FD-325 SS-3]
MEDYMTAIRAMNLEDLDAAVEFTVPAEQRPSRDFVNSLTSKQQHDVLRATLLIYVLTNGQKTPREFQLRAALGPLSNKDSMIVAGTGSGKTLAMALPCVLRPGTVSLVLCPMKRLQMTQVAEYAKYGVRAAAINMDTPDDPIFWKDVQDGNYNLLLVSPEQRRSVKGHLGRFAKMLLDRTFTARIERLHVDEAHFIYTVGIEHHGQAPFRPAYGDILSWRILLQKDVSLQTLTATSPSHIRRVILDKTGLASDYLSVALSLNRPRTIYATHPMVGGTNNFANFDCLIPAVFHPPMCLRRTLIFSYERKEVAALANYLDELLPESYRRGIRKLQAHRPNTEIRLKTCMPYNSGMSEEVLNFIFASYNDPSGIVQLLSTTSALATGVDMAGVHTVIDNGPPPTMTDAVQRAGRSDRGTDAALLFPASGLYVIFVPPWVYDTDLVSEDEDPHDPDAPPNWQHLKKKKYTTRQERTGRNIIEYCKSEFCLRDHIATYLDDDTYEATTVAVGVEWCCSNHASSTDRPFDLSHFFYRPMLTGNEIKPKAAPTPRVPTRDTNQRPLLTDIITRWRLQCHQSDPLRTGRTIYSILTDQGLKLLIKHDPKKVNSGVDIGKLLNETDEWINEWGVLLYELIIKSTARILADAIVRKAKKKVALDKKKSAAAMKKMATDENAAVERC